MSPRSKLRSAVLVVATFALSGCGGPAHEPTPEVDFPPSARSSAPINENWPSTTPGGEPVSSGGAIARESEAATTPSSTNKKTGR